MTVRLPPIRPETRPSAGPFFSALQEIVKSLTELRDEASTLRTQLGHDAAVVGQRGRKAVNTGVAGIRRGPGRPAGSKNASIIVGGKTKRKLSAKAGAAISVAQKKRWAKLKARAQKK